VGCLPTTISDMDHLRIDKFAVWASALASLHLEPPAAAPIVVAAVLAHTTGRVRRSRSVLRHQHQRLGTRPDQAPAEITMEVVDKFLTNNNAQRTSSSP
jgi:hypothetical protein